MLADANLLVSVLAMLGFRPFVKVAIQHLHKYTTSPVQISQSEARLHTSLYNRPMLHNLI